MPKVLISIRNCRDCPHWKRTPSPTPDSFERPHDWWCTACNPHKKIAGYVEWHEESKTKIPEWCPLLVETDERERVPRPDVQQHVAPEVAKIAEDYIDFLFSDEYHDDNDYTQFIFEGILEYVYGKDVFKTHINPRQAEAYEDRRKK